jgi:hypothetical protein
MRMKYMSQSSATVAAIVLCLCLFGSTASASVSYDLWNKTIDSLPALDAMDSTLGTPAETGLVGNFDISKMAGKDGFVFRFKSYIKIETAGTYTFYTSSDDGNILYVGEWATGGAMTKVVDNNGLHGAQQRAGRIDLSAGYHGVIVAMFEKDGDESLVVSYKGPGIPTKIVIPASVLFIPGVSTVSPADKAINVPVTSQIEWAAPADYIPAGYDVYISNDANLPMSTKVVSAQNVTSYDPPGNLLLNKTYYWRVDAYDPNSGGNPILRTGPVWSFTTQPETLILTTQPRGVFVNAGETATFTVTALSPTSIAYKWFKVGTTDTPVGTDSPTLIVPNVLAINEGEYYCKATDSAGSIESNRASLTIKKLVGRWPFDGNLNDVVGANHGTAVGSPDVTAEGKVGSNAVKTSEGNYLSVPWTPTPSLSISFWVQPESNAGNDYIIGCGDPSGAENFFARMTNITTGYDVAFNGGATRFAYLTYPVAWNHEVFTYDQTTLTATWYINDVLVGTISGLTLTQPVDSRIYVGNRKNGQRRYTGKIDELKLYNYPLNAFEVQKIYSQDTGTPLCLNSVPNDLNGDCRVDLADFALLAANWLKCNLVPESICP